MFSTIQQFNDTATKLAKRLEEHKSCDGTIMLVFDENRTLKLARCKKCDKKDFPETFGIMKDKIKDVMRCLKNE